MAFPDLKPSKRNFESGDFPVKKFKSQSGEETRVLFGSKRTGMKMSLTYKNIADADAEKFLDHYHEMKGTYTTFTVAAETKAGWSGNGDAIGAGEWDNAYRYSAPPKLIQVKNGVSTIQVNLIGVL